MHLGRASTPPTHLRSERLLLRRWRADDAARLHPILEVNVEHLKPWIPWTTAEPVPVPELEARLTRFNADFDAGIAFRYAILTLDERTLLGGASLHPRSGDARVPFASADHIEIGYWLRADATGRGYATEAARAMLEVARALPHMDRVLIRCDPRNAPSAAVPARLGFTHAVAAVPDRETMVWELRLESDG